MVPVQGSSVVSGSGRAVVLSTGTRTLMATYAASGGSSSHASEFAAAMWRITFVFIAFIAVMVPIVIVVNGKTTGEPRGWGVGRRRGVGCVACTTLLHHRAGPPSRQAASPSW